MTKNASDIRSLHLETGSRLAQLGSGTSLAEKFYIAGARNLHPKP